MTERVIRRESPSPTLALGLRVVRADRYAGMSSASIRPLDIHGMLREPRPTSHVCFEDSPTSSSASMSYALSMTDFCPWLPHRASSVCAFSPASQYPEHAPNKSDYISGFPLSKLCSCLDRLHTFLLLSSSRVFRSLSHYSSLPLHRQHIINIISSPRPGLLLA
jgi:hypothetical protein